MSVSKWAGWLMVMRPRSVADFSSLIPFVPVLLLMTGLFVRRARILLALLPGCFFSLYYSYQRLYSHTLIEVSLLFFVVTVAWFATVARVCTAGRPPEASKRYRVISDFFSRFLCTGLALLLVFLIGPTALLNAKSYHSHNRKVDAASKRLRALMRDSGGITAFLTVENTYRPNTVDGAIAKAGQWTTNLENPDGGPVHTSSPYFRTGGVILFLKPLEEKLTATKT